MVVHERDLPADRANWDELFLAMLGSPDPYGRQLDGMGGGLSSVSKVCVVGPPTHPDADIDYTFAQVQVKEAIVDHRSNSGNMVSAVGPFAVDEGLVKAAGEEALVRVHVTTTKKIVHVRFAIDNGMAAVDGDLAIPGVTGRGAPVQVEFLDPGGAVTGRLLPTGNVVDVLDVPGIGKIRVSMIDAATAACFVDAADLGITGTETPQEIDSAADVMAMLDRIRIAASVAMGIGRDASDAASNKGMPLIGFVSGPKDAKSLAGDVISGDNVDLTARMISNGQAHRALPGTGSLCTAVAARIEGTIVHQLTRPTSNPDAAIRIAMPSGVMVMAAKVKQTDGVWHAERGVLYRTQRRLFEGYVLVRASSITARSGTHTKQAANS